MEQVALCRAKLDIFQSELALMCSLAGRAKSAAVLGPPPPPPSPAAAAAQTAAAAADPSPTLQPPPELFQRPSPKYHRVLPRMPPTSKAMSTTSGMPGTPPRAMPGTPPKAVQPHAVPAKSDMPKVPRQPNTPPPKKSTPAEIEPKKMPQQPGEPPPAWLCAQQLQSRRDADAAKDTS